MGNYDISHSPYSSFNSPQPLAPAIKHEQVSSPFSGIMGPPEKPKAERQLGVEQLNDMVAIAGVDLKEEENYLSGAYLHPQRTQSSGTAVNSFGSVASWSSTSPEATFANWSQSPTAHQMSQTGRPVGPLSQPPITPASMEELLKSKHKAAARRQAEKQQVHLRDPFLLANIVRQKMQRKTLDSQVRFRDDSVRTLEGGDSNNLQVAGRRWDLQNGGTLIAANTTIVSADSSLPNILSLLSLATQQRTRDLLEDAYALSRSRSYGSGGRVPREWLDIAKGNGQPEKVTIQPESISRTPWDAIPDSAVSPLTVIPAKRSHDVADGTHNPLTPPPDPEPTLETVRYPSPVPAILRRNGEQALADERARLARRKKRLESKDKDTPQSTPADTGSPAEAAPGTDKTKSTPPPAIPEIKMTKKDREKQAKAGQTDEVLQRNANETANMQLGSLKSKYSWMTSSAARPASGITAGAGMREKLAGKNKATPAAKSTQKQENAGLEAKNSYKQLGLLKDAPTILPTDFINVLERDGKEKKSLMRAYSRLGTDRTATVQNP
jgi:hypothetical protein